MTKPAEAALITMPCAPAELPSIQLGLLKSCLNEVGITSEAFHFTVDFYLHLHRKKLHNLYNSLLPGLVGEWFFSDIPFDNASPHFRSAETKLQTFAGSAGRTVEELRDIKESIAPVYLESLLQATDWNRFKVAAFTLSYAQVNASVRLAKELKKRFPRLVTIFGGAFSQLHEESIPEFMRIFSGIDYCVLGEAEPVFGPLVKGIIDGKIHPSPPPAHLPGIFYHEDDKAKTTGGVSQLIGMDSYRSPDYTDYFHRLKTMEPDKRVHFHRAVPVEMSRGCVWGQHQPCTFCAFYPCRTYRPRPADKVVDEITNGARNYRTRSFYIVDAAVDGAQIESVFAPLARTGKPFTFPFVQVRPSITQSHIRTLKEAGVNLLQPGIECLDSGILRKVNKGVSVFHNLLFMKWCRQYDINLSYNIILGIPDVTEEEMENQIRIMRAVTHLAPPHPMPLALVRFSRYLSQRESYPLINIEFDDFYRFVFPDDMDLEKVAYNFTADNPATKGRMAELFQKTVECIEHWGRMWSNPRVLPFMTFSFRCERGTVLDGRTSPFKPVSHDLSELETAIYRQCMSKPLNIKSLLHLLQNRNPSTRKITGESVHKTLQDLVEKGLMLQDGSLYLALAVEEKK